MVRGRKAEIGDTRIAPNGYHYTRTPDGWESTHRILLERKLGRKLRRGERARFKDGNRANLDPANLEVYTTKPPSANARRARLEAKIDELQAELEELDNDDRS